MGRFPALMIPGASLALPRVQLPGDESQGGLHLMRSMKPPGVIDRGRKGRCGHRAPAGGRAQALDSRVGARDCLDHPVRVRERLIDRLLDREQGRHLRAQAARRRERHHPPAKGVCTPCRHAPAVPAQQRSGQDDVSGARPDQGILSPLRCRSAAIWEAKRAESMASRSCEDVLRLTCRARRGD